MNIFTKARAGVNLTPGQRALLKLIEGFGIAGLVAALPVVAAALSSRAPLVWPDVGRTALAAFAVAFFMAIVKYLKAQGDAPLPDAIEGVLQSAASRIAEDNHLPETNLLDVPDSADSAPVTRL